MTPSKGSRTPFANVLWFPLAATYAAVMLPWSVAAQLGLWPAPAGITRPWGHGHEMLFGFALAVVTGYTSGQQPRRTTLQMIGLWLLARLAFLGWPLSLPAILLNVAFVIALAWKVAPTFLRTAKKWRNKSVGVILIGVALSVIAFHIAAHMALPPSLFLLEAVLFLSALIFFMGGRMIAPAIAGHVEKTQGYILEARVQPALEGAVLLLLLMALVVNVLPVGARPAMLAALLLACALLTLVRMVRWQGWRCRDRLDLLALLAGYGWLMAGWVLIALSLTTEALPLSQALHAITVGALGTLTLSVMARVRMHRCLRDPNAWPWVYGLNLLIAAAALIRLTVHWLPYTQGLMLAALCWSLAYGGLLVLLVRLGQQEKKNRPHGQV